MDDIIIGVMVFAVFITAAFMGAHTNINAQKVHLAIELCEPNGGLEYIDWSNAGCKNGAKIDLYRQLSND